MNHFNFPIVFQAAVFAGALWLTTVIKDGTVVLVDLPVLR
jgi:hypothetical protein